MEPSESDSGALVTVPYKPLPNFDAALVTHAFSSAHRKLIMTTICPKGTTEEQLELFLYQCFRTRLDPLCRQIYMLILGGKPTFIASIDGLRVLAARTGLYLGCTPTQWCNREGVWTDIWLDSTCPPSGAKVGVRVKHGAGEYIVWAVATTRSYNTGQGLWSKMPDVMIEKCATAKALRSAFPHDISGLYGPEEMEQAK